MQEMMKKRARELLSDNTVDRVLGWSRGDLFFERSPDVFRSPEELDLNFVYDGFCGANLSKFLINENKRGGRILVFLKPCDTFSLNQLMTEHRINRENLYIIGIPSPGMLDGEKISRSTDSAVLSVEDGSDEVVLDTLDGKVTLKREEYLLEKCRSCKSGAHMVYDELIGEEGAPKDTARFDDVQKLENMSAQERFDFWRGELSRCIRCNACRNACPACSCEKCIFDNDNMGTAIKAAADSFEENMFHIIRAFHVAGRCTDCGECSRVCPENIPLHLLNRKFIKDINELYGDYQAGESEGQRNPLISYTVDDSEPSIVHERGND